MTNEYYGVASTPTETYLAHYGIKGMKWGVRKARAVTNLDRQGRMMDRQYRKAAKKLAKLERRAESGKKYAKRAAALGAGAALAGGAAIGGTAGVGKVLRRAGGLAGKAGSGASKILTKAGYKIRGPIGTAIATAGRKANTLGNILNTAGVKSGMGLEAWGARKHDVAGAAKNIISKHGNKAANLVGKQGGGLADRAGAKAASLINKTGHGTVSGNTLFRLGTAGIGAGLGAGAAYNAYRAATTKRAARKAAQWRSEMNKAFAGTKYANGGSGQRSSRRRRRG